jgi:hypothetical protein
MAKIIRIRKAGPDDPIFNVGSQFFKPIERPSNWRELDDGLSSNPRQTLPADVSKVGQPEKPE